MPNHSLHIRILPLATAMALTGCASWQADDYIDYTTDAIVYVEPAEPQMAAALPYIDEALDEGIRPALYASAGVGMSLLTPDTSEAPDVSVTDDSAGAGQISIGLDVNKHLALELHSSDLGSAGLTGGRINYHLNGFSALYYAGKNRGNNVRRGFTAFGRAGVAMSDNSASGDINFRQNSKTQFLFGGGLEYNTRSGFGLRAELINFDKDAQYAQLGLMYRLGKQDRMVEVPSSFSAPPSIQQTTALPQPPVPAIIPAVSKPLPTLEPIAEQKIIEQPIVSAPIVAAKPRVVDSDGDGVADNLDRCQRTGRRVAIDNHGCALFNGRIDGVSFETASAELSDEGVDSLADIAYTLRKYPQANLLVKAHTDNQGEPQRNQKLSERRARAVVDYLSRQGITYDRMRAKAYGERNPIDTNSSAAGRAANRRVEFYAFNPGS